MFGGGVKLQDGEARDDTQYEPEMNHFRALKC